MEDQDFSFLGVDTSEAQELKVLENGWNGDLTVASAEPKSQNGFNMVEVFLDTGEEFTRRVKHTLFYPKDDDDADKRNSSLLNIKRFHEAFEIEGDDILDPSAWVGAKAYGTLKIKHVKTKSGDEWDENQVKSFAKPA